MVPRQQDEAARAAAEGDLVSSDCSAEDKRGDGADGAVARGGGGFRRGCVLRRSTVIGPRLIDHLTDRRDDELGLVELDPVSASCGDDMAAVRGKPRQRPMLLDPLVR